MDQREIDPTTPNGRLLFGILAAVTECERALIKDRQLGGHSPHRDLTSVGNGKVKKKARQS